MSEEGESINENINLSSEKEAAPKVLENEWNRRVIRRQGAIEQPSLSQLEVQANQKNRNQKQL